MPRPRPRPRRVARVDKVVKEAAPVKEAKKKAPQKKEVKKVVKKAVKKTVKKEEAPKRTFFKKSYSSKSE